MQYSPVLFLYSFIVARGAARVYPRGCVASLLCGGKKAAVGLSGISPRMEVHLTPFKYGTGLLLLCLIGFMAGRMLADCASPAPDCWACTGRNPPPPVGDMVWHDNGVSMSECWCPDGSTPSAAYCRTEICTNCPTSGPDITAKMCMSEQAAREDRRVICTGPC